MAESSNDNMPMDDDHRQILRNVREKLVEDMDSCDVLLKMGASNVFSDKDEEKIQSKKTKVKQNTTFFALLPCRGPNAYDSFKDALQRCHQKFLAYILTDAENKFKLKKELNNSAGVRKQMKEVLTSAKERVTTNRPESEVDELKNDSDKDNERVDTSLKKQTYPNNNEQFQSLDDLSKEKRCQQCCDLKKENEVLRSELDKLHGEKLKRHDKKDNKRQTGKNLEEQRTEETQSKSKNDKESLKAEPGQKIKTSSNEKKMVGEIPGKGYRELSTQKDEDQLCADKWKSGTVSGTYVSLPCGEDTEGKAIDVLSHIQYKSGSAEEKKDSCCCVIDLGENKRLFPTQFALSETKEPFVLQGKTDDGKWKNLKIAKMKQGPPRQLAQLNSWHTATDTKRAWLVKGEVSAFRYFRILQTVKYSDRSHCHCPFPGLELYGVLLKRD